MNSNEQRDSLIFEFVEVHCSNNRPFKYPNWLSVDWSLGLASDLSLIFPYSSFLLVFKASCEEVFGTGCSCDYIGDGPSIGCSN